MKNAHNSEQLHHIESHFDKLSLLAHAEDLVLYKVTEHRLNNFNRNNSSR